MLEKDIAALDWNNSRDKQVKAIAAVVKNIGDDLSPILFINLKKAQWENAATVLGKIEVAKVIKYIPTLLEWLMDVNWPGATRVYGVLLEIPEHLLLPHLDNAISQALEEADEEWLESLHDLQNKAPWRVFAVVPL